MLVDTHAHLYLKQFEEDRADVVQRAVDAGVKKILLPNIDNSTIEGMLEMEQKFPGICFPMIGLHPCSVDQDYEKQLGLVEEWVGKHSFVAIGEIGMDLYWDTTYRNEQEKAFRRQIVLAKEHGLPIVIHSRETLDFNIDIVSELQDGTLAGVFHCFTGTVEQGRKIADLGFYMGLGGVLTFKNGGLDAVVPHLPLEHMVLETDAPYLTPAPYRGKRNESAYVELIADKMAEACGIDRHQVEHVTTANAVRLFPKLSG